LISLKKHSYTNGILGYKPAQTAKTTPGYISQQKKCLAAKNIGTNLQTQTYPEAPNKPNT